MDEPIEPTRLAFGPDHRLTAVLALGAVATGITAALTGDAAGRLLWAAAALLLVGYVLTDLLFWPRLAVDAAGLRVRSPLQRATFGWDEIDEVRADIAARHGLRTVTLEIDSGDTLLVLSRRQLGADPEVVATLVHSLDPRGLQRPGLEPPGRRADHHDQ